MTEYMTLHEALAWIVTGDQSAARLCRDTSSLRFSIEISRLASEIPRTRPLGRARRMLLDRCSDGRVLAKGFRKERNLRWPQGDYWIFSSKIERIDASEWVLMHLDLEDAKPKKEDTPHFRAPVFKRKDVIEQFPPPAAAPPPVQPPKPSDPAPANYEDAPSVEAWPEVEDKASDIANDYNAAATLDYVAADEPTPTPLAGGLVAARPPRKHRGAESLAEPDAPFVKLMRELVLANKCTVNAAAGIVLADNRDKIRRQPRADDESVIRRLRERYKATHREDGE